MALVLILGVGVFVWRVFFTVSAYDGALTSTSDMDRGCSDSRKYFPSAASYTGPGPHPVAVFRDSDGSGGEIDQVRPEHYSGDSPYRVEEPGRIQLIACLGGADEGERLGDCHFNGGESLPLYQGEYDAVLYEARTGKKVAEVRLHGSSDPEDCPYALYAKGNPDLHTEPDEAELRDAFGRYVYAGG